MSLMYEFPFFVLRSVLRAFEWFEGGLVHSIGPGVLFLHLDFLFSLQKSI